MPIHERRSISAADDTASGSAGYIHQARRLRHRLRDNPAQMHACLRKLSLRSSTPVTVTRLAPEQVAAPLLADPITVSAFADQVAEALDGGVLRYSNRLALLARAEELGIGRFEANLIIASVQHRHEAAPPPPSQRSLWPLLVAAAIAAQAAIVLAVWRLFTA